MDITFAKPSSPSVGGLAVIASENSGLAGTAAILDKKMRGSLSRAMASEKFTGKDGQILVVLAPSGLRAERVILTGIGKGEKFDSGAAEKLGGRIVGHLKSLGVAYGAVAVDSIAGSELDAAAIAAHIGYGASLRGYLFARYKTRASRKSKPRTRKLTIMTSDPAKARTKYRPLRAVANGVFMTRDLVSEPANILYPEELAARTKNLINDGVKVEILTPTKMRELGMGALLGVAQGSAREPRLVVMQWQGAPNHAPKQPIAFIGKGVTFDTGGISIKPSAGMGDMKWDMGGSGVVIGVMRALDQRKAKTNAGGVVGLVENMPSGTAQRPGDIVTSMSGQTIEVLNTDAEGRLVLADAVWYTQDRFKPRIMVDLATLTGAIIVSLGSERAGLFSNDKDLSQKLMDAGEDVGEKLWPMPMDESYDAEIDCDIADMQNIGSGRGAGSVTAAKFIERFVRNTPWAHLDIAGVTWSKKEQTLVPKGGTAFGVRLLNKLVAEHYEYD